MRYLKIANLSSNKDNAKENTFSRYDNRSPFVLRRALYHVVRLDGNLSRTKGNVRVWVRCQKKKNLSDPGEN